MNKDAFMMMAGFSFDKDVYFQLIAMSSEEFDDFMCLCFPDIFKDRNSPMNQTCMCWGFEHGKGWNPIMFDMCRKIEALNKAFGVKVVAHQVKEKYGTLAFYFSPVLPEASTHDLRVVESLYDALAVWLEEMSAKTCEECGDFALAQICNKGVWLKTLCSDCANQLGYTYSS